MQFNPAFHLHLEHHFTQFFKTTVQIKNTLHARGGDINQCFIVETSAGPFFLKVNAALFGLDFFEKEARGLLALTEAGALKIPQPLFDGKFHQEIYLVMEYLGQSRKKDDFWSSFGKGLARLHRKTNNSFGWFESNYIGRLTQENNFLPDWSSFYTENRILNNIRKAIKKQLLENADLEMAEKFCLRLAGIVPSEPPALLHGDLWSGNFIALENGQAAVFDPAVYYGHRETDLAMTRLFGGFDDAFYEAYQSEYPLADGWQERISLFQLYPLLIHLLLFGGHYQQSVRDILKKFP